MTKEQYDEIHESLRKIEAKLFENPIITFDNFDPLTVKKQTPQDAVVSEISNRIISLRNYLSNNRSILIDT